MALELLTRRELEVINRRMEQVVLLLPQVMEYGNVWRVDAKAMVMDIREICAEKIRASSGRARYRDFYDLFMIWG